MSQSFADFIAVLKSVLTREEYRDAVIYAIEKPIPEGTQLQFPGLKIDVIKKSYIAFVDRQPMANWGHSARYVLIGGKNKNETKSFETRLPPFKPFDKLVWCIVYKASLVPDSIIRGFKLGPIIISSNQ